MVSPGAISSFLKFLFFHSSYLRNFTSYDCGFCYTCVRWWYAQHFFFSFFQNSDFFYFSKFINKWQIEIMRCAAPSSHACDFPYILVSLKKGVHVECNEIFRSNVHFFINWDLVTRVGLLLVQQGWIHFESDLDDTKKCNSVRFLL